MSDSPPSLGGLPHVTRADLLTPMRYVGYTGHSSKEQPPEGRTQTMATKRTITFTAPDGTPLSVNVGPKRQVSAVRVLDYQAFDPAAEGTSRWLISVHGTVMAAVKGPNQTPSWNVMPRHVLLIEEDDQPSRDGWYAVPR